MYLVLQDLCARIRLSPRLLFTAAVKVDFGSQGCGICYSFFFAFGKLRGQSMMYSRIFLRCQSTVLIRLKLSETHIDCGYLLAWPISTWKPRLRIHDGLIRDM